MTKKALLIGNNYTGTKVALKGCINDVMNISNVLQTKCGFTSPNIIVATEATRAVMESSIQRLVSGSRPGDVLFFYYSGHGSTLKDVSGDEKDGYDEVLVPVDYSTNGFILDDWLYANLASKVPGGVTLWGFTDCCHSGTMCDLTYNWVPNCTVKKGNPRTPYNTSNWTDVFTMSTDRRAPLVGNVTFFAGCLDNQVSYESSGQGAFTKCLIEFLNQKSVFVNNTVRLSELLKYIHCNLKINGFPSQVPQLSIGRLIGLESYFNL
jgi:hypothetical protein